MIDTIRLVYHGIFKKTDDALQKIQREKRIDDLDVPFDLKNINLEYGDFRFPGHIQLYEKLLKTKELIRNRTEKRRKHVTTDTLQASELIKNSSKFKNDMSIDYNRYVSETHQKDYLLSVKGSTRISSSSNDIVFGLEPEKDQIWFEFSIPKFLFGHSLAEFIPQPASKWNNGERFLSIPKHQKKILWRRLHEFIEFFTNKLECDFNLNFQLHRTMIEIARIDICYNQYFSSKAEALAYLEYQAKIHKKRQTSKTNKAHEYLTGLTYVIGGNSYFKIYHKGTEYVRATIGDIHKHRKINEDNLILLAGKGKISPEFGKPETLRKLAVLLEAQVNDRLSEAHFYDKYLQKEDKKLVKMYKKYKELSFYNVVHLKQNMDRVLRYELTIRPGWMASAYKRKCFRQNDPIHMQMHDNYKRVHNIFENNKDEKVKRIDSKNYKNLKNFYDTTIRMMYQSNKKMEKWHENVQIDYRNDVYKPRTVRINHGQLWRYDVGFFDKKMMALCLERFYREVTHYEVKQFDQDLEYRVLVQKYNEKASAKIEAYNTENAIKVWENNLTPGRKKINYATDLLTDSKMRDLDLLPMTYWKLKGVFKLMNGTDNDETLSFDQAAKKLDLSKYQKSRYKKDLEKLGVFQNSLKVEKRIECSLDFREYYENLENPWYRMKFYSNPRQVEIN